MGEDWEAAMEEGGVDVRENLPEEQQMEYRGEDGAVCRARREEETKQKRAPSP